MECPVCGSVYDTGNLHADVISCVRSLAARIMVLEKAVHIPLPEKDVVRGDWRREAG